MSSFSVPSGRDAPPFGAIRADAPDDLLPYARVHIPSGNPRDAVLLISADEQIVAINPAAEALLGYTGDRLLRLQLSEIVDQPGDWTDTALARLAHGGSVVDDLALRRGDGTLVAVEVEASAVQLPSGVAYVAVVRDLRERRRAEAALRASQEQLQSIVETSPDLICILNRDGRYQFANAAYRWLLGYDPAALLGTSTFDLIHPDDAPPVVERFRGLVAPSGPLGSTAGILNNACRVRHAQGHWLWVEPRWRMLRDEDGGFAGVLVISRDVTEHQQFEEERERLLAQEQAARAQAESALRVRDEFLSSISHELRTPLTVIKGFTQALTTRAARRPEEERDRLVAGLAKIDSNATRMARLVDELLDLGRLEVGRPLALDPCPTDLVALAREVVAEQQKTTNRHRFIVEPRVPDLVGVWDAERLRRVLGNLLANAVRYSPAGGSVRVDLGWEVDDGCAEWARVLVEDEGIGIPEADLHRVFERFHRGANVGAIWGTGIGLALVRQVVEQHGGTTTIASTEGQGTTVTLRLPLG